MRENNLQVVEAMIDLLLVTGPVSRNMATALRRTFDAAPEPKLVVAVGHRGCDGGFLVRTMPASARFPTCLRWTSGCPAALRRRSRFCAGS
jgi:Ni,Fe-hydrogenase III small subunit